VQGAIDRRQEDCDRDEGDQQRSEHPRHLKAADAKAGDLRDVFDQEDDDPRGEVLGSLSFRRRDQPHLNVLS